MSSWETFARALPDSAEINADERLSVGGVDVRDLAATYGTPLFVFCEQTFRARLAAYREAFGGANVHYAGKAFLAKSLIPILVDEGVGLDVASGGELHAALAGGMDPAKIVMHGNNKSAEELEYAVEQGVGRIVVDSHEELIALDRIAGQQMRAQQIYLRITPGIEAHTHDFLKTGIEDTKFGVPIGAPALEAVKLAEAATNVELVGLHSHIGSQIFDIEPFGEAARVMIGFLAQCRAETGLALPDLDLGGGWGITYTSDDDPLPIRDLGKVVGETIATEAERLGTPAPAVHVEPGRSIAGPSMLTLYTSGVVKEISGVRTYVSIDGGMSDNIRPALYGAKYTFLSATRPGAAHDTSYAIAGKLCESGDILTKDALLPELRPGELIAVAATGAYCYAMSSNYNKTPRPAVVAVREGEHRVLVRRETWDDLIALDS